MKIVPKNFKGVWCAQVTLDPGEEPPKSGSIVEMKSSAGGDIVQLGEIIYNMNRVYIYERIDNINPADGIFLNDSKKLSKSIWNHLKALVTHFNAWASRDLQITRVHAVDSGGEAMVYWRCGNNPNHWEGTYETDWYEDGQLAGKKQHEATVPYNETNLQDAQRFMELLEETLEYIAQIDLAVEKVKGLRPR